MEPDAEGKPTPGSATQNLNITMTITPGVSAQGL